MPLPIIKNFAQFVTSSPAAGALPVAVTALAEGVIQMMWLARLKPLVAVAAAAPPFCLPQGALYRFACRTPNCPPCERGL
jgi:hypothetical protein